MSPPGCQSFIANHHPAGDRCRGDPRVRPSPLLILLLAQPGRKGAPAKPAVRHGVTGMRLSSPIFRADLILRQIVPSTTHMTAVHLLSKVTFLLQKCNILDTRMTVILELHLRLSGCHQPSVLRHRDSCKISFYIPVSTGGRQR